MAFQGNYYNPMQSNPYGFNNVYQQPIMQPQIQQPNQQSVQSFRQPIGLPGKIVDSLEAVKAADIPLDGSISYFVLANGEAIATKQLMQDGTSKTIIYKPSTDKEIIEEKNKYITEEEFNEKIKKINNNDFKDEIKTIKKQIREILKDIEEINEDRKD